MVSLSALVTKGSLGGDNIPADNFKKKTKKIFNLLMPSLRTDQNQKCSLCRAIKKDSSLRHMNAPDPLLSRMDL